MKYIKLYESFDIEEIKDCFLDIIDYGFEVDISNVDKNTSSSSGFAGNDKSIYITINKIISGFGQIFNYKEVKECLLFAVPYIQEKYKFPNFDMCVYYYNAWATTDVYLNEYLYRRGMSIGGNELIISGRKLNPFISGIQLHFYE